MNIYFSGIGGVGIGPLAEIALDAGYDIVGSDATEGLMTSELKKRGVDVSIGQDGSFLRNQHHNKTIDWFVYTAALPHNHPELLAARELGIKTAKRDELLAHIISEKNLKLIAIAGTHGKTTTTGMMVWALKQLGVPVSYSIGTTLSWGPSGLYDPKSQYFVYECDEFDRNFLHFNPYLSLITSVEHDHPDTYPTADEYFKAFGQFVDQSAHSIAWQNDLSFLAENSSTWLLGANEISQLRLPGQHNRQNATLVEKGIEYLSLPPVSQILEQFPGTNRRFEKIDERIYSDYGHTPTEITATLQMAREISTPVALIYQPHQNIRQHEILNQYTDAVFAGADEIYWLPTYLSREDPALEVLSPEQLTVNLSKANLHISDLNDELWQTIVELQQKGYLVLCMGAGDIDNWLRRQSSN